MPDVFLVLGESLVDVVRRADGSTVEHPGGSPANLAVALARLGTRVELATAFGSDRRGDLLHRHLTSEGLELVGEPRVLERTSTARATIDSSGSASYAFDLHAELPDPAVSLDRVHVHTGSVGAVLPPGSDVVARAIETHAHRATVSYDVNARPALTGAGPGLVACVEQISRLSDVVKASDDDLAVVYPDRPLAEAARRLLSLGPAAVVVTRGRAGAVCFSRDAVVDLLGVRVDVVDTIGAGDSFCAGLLDGLGRARLLGAPSRSSLHTAPVRVWWDVIARAVAAATITVTRPGADPPTAADLDAAHPSPSALVGWP